MNSGLDWMWVEMLTVMVDWIGLDFEKWTHGHLWSQTRQLASVQLTQSINPYRVNELKIYCTISRHLSSSVIDSSFLCNILEHKCQ